MTEKPQSYTLLRSPLDDYGLVGVIDWDKKHYPYGFGGENHLGGRCESFTNKEVYLKSEIDKYIDALRTEIVEKVVEDFTRWRKCDPVTGKPDEEYFRSKPKLTLVKVKFSYIGEDIEVINIARWDLNAKCWKFQCSEDPMNGPEYKGVYRVSGWKPIY